MLDAAHLKQGNHLIYTPNTYLKICKPAPFGSKRCVSLDFDYSRTLDLFATLLRCSFRNLYTQSLVLYCHLTVLDPG